MNECMIRLTVAIPYFSCDFSMKTKEFMKRITILYIKQHLISHDNNNTMYDNNNTIYDNNNTVNKIMVIFSQT